MFLRELWYTLYTQDKKILFELGILKKIQKLFLSRANDNIQF